MFLTRPRHFWWFKQLGRTLYTRPKSEFLSTNHIFDRENCGLRNYPTSPLLSIRTYCAEVINTKPKISKDCEFDDAANELTEVRSGQRKRAGKTSDNDTPDVTSSKKPLRARRSRKVSDEGIDDSSQVNIKKKGSKTKVSSKPVASKSSKRLTKEKPSYSSILPLFPFEGQTSKSVSYSPLEDEFGSCAQRAEYDIKRVDSNDGRFYHITSSKQSFCFPSVTTVLDATKPRAMFYRLENWKKNMIKEHGRSGFKKMSANTLRSGTNFHKVFGFCL